MMKKKILATMVLGLGITLAQSAIAQNTNSVLAKIKQTYPNLQVEKVNYLPDIKLYELILKGNIKEAQPLAYALDPISRLLFIDVNPIMPKAALAKMGVCGEHLRLPLIETTEENKKALFGAMDEFEKLGY